MKARDEIFALSKSEIRKIEDDHVYVLNMSDRGDTQPRSELLITVPMVGTPHGINVKVPNTWIPIDLSAQVPKNALIENRDFLLHLSRKDMRVIARVDAEALMDDDDAQEEYNRIYDINQEDDQTPALFEVDSTSNDPYDRASDGMRKRLSKGNLKKEICSTKVLAVMTKENVTENQKLASLKNIRGTLKADDYKYIIKSAKAGEFDKLKSWAITCLAEL